MTEPAEEPIGLDPAVREAMSVLERAMAAAAARNGHVLQTCVLLWASEKDGDGYGGSLLKGDLSEGVVEFLTDILNDGSEDVEVTNSAARLQ